MQTAKRDIWHLYDKGFDVVVTTNIGWDPQTLVNNMGAGTVLRAARMFPGLSRWYGAECKRMTEANSVEVLYRPDLRLYFLPVKPLLDARDPERSWDQLGNYALIEQGLRQFAQMERKNPVALTLPGCGNGGLNRREMLTMVKAVLGELEGVTLCDLELPVQRGTSSAASFS